MKVIYSNEIAIILFNEPMTYFNLILQLHTLVYLILPHNGRAFIPYGAILQIMNDSRDEQIKLYLIHTNNVLWFMKINNHSHKYEFQHLIFSVKL